MRTILKLSSVLIYYSCFVIFPIQSMEVLDAQPIIVSSQEESLDRFTITLNKIPYEFHQVDFLNLKESKEDYDNYVKATCDKDAVKQMLGGIIANIFGVLSWIYPPIAYEAMIDLIKREKDKKTTCERLTWFIYDESKNDHPYVGYMGLFPPNMVLSDELLSKMKVSSDDVIEISMAFTKNYRGGKGIATKLGAEVLNKLMILDQFKGKTLLVRTRPDNTPVHVMAKKLGFQMVDTITEELDCGLFKKEITLDLFSLNLSELGG